MKQLRYSFVYQAGIANVFQVENWNLSPFGRDAKRIMQSDFRTCEAFARGLAAGGHLVQTFACNEAGDIAGSKWSDDLEAQPFSDKFRPVNQSKIASNDSPLGFFMEDSEATANAQAIAALPALLKALEMIHANAAESPEWIRRHTVTALTAAGYQF